MPVLRPRRLLVVRPALALGGGSMVGFAIVGGTDPLLAAFARVGATAAVAPVALAARAGGADQPHGFTGQRGSPAAAFADQPGGDATQSESTASGTAARTRGRRSGEGGPCDEQRRVVDERCALADRLRDQAGTAAIAGRDAQREYDEHLTKADKAAATADPRTLRTAKETAQHAFRRARDRAGSQQDVETAARTWLQEINRINQSAREAAAVLQVERDAANGMVATLERLTLEADAARISAESAAEGCVAAREALAVCEEAEHERKRGRKMPLQPSLGPDERPQPIGVAASGGAAATATESEDEEAGTLAAFARGSALPAIAHLLAGDRVVLTALVDELSAEEPTQRRHWQMALTDLIDGLVARAIEAAALDFPTDHPFWGAFTRDDCRDIARALASLGYRFDGLGGFVDDRVPGQRDLSLATGYAGLDPMRIRHWPSETEMPDLFRDVNVAAFEYLVGAAGGLTLGELLSLLGRRADGLTDLWNAWGRVRPLLLEAL